MSQKASSLCSSVRWSSVLSTPQSYSIRCAHSASSVSGTRKGLDSGTSSVHPGFGSGQSPPYRASGGKGERKRVGGVPAVPRPATQTCVAGSLRSGGNMYKLLRLGFVVASLALPPLVAGCASHPRTGGTDGGNYPDGTAYRTEPPVVEHQTTTTETTSAGGCGGVLSCTVDVTGEVVALPFRAVGGLLSAIF